MFFKYFKNILKEYFTKKRSSWLLEQVVYYDRIPEYGSAKAIIQNLVVGEYWILVRDTEVWLAHEMCCGPLCLTSVQKFYTEQTNCTLINSPRPLRTSTETLDSCNVNIPLL